MRYVSDGLKILVTDFHKLVEKLHSESLALNNAHVFKSINKSIKKSNEGHRWPNVRPY